MSREQTRESVGQLANRLKVTCRVISSAAFKELGKYTRPETLLTPDESNRVIDYLRRMQPASV